MRSFVKNALLCALFLAGLALLLRLASPVAVPKGNAERDGMPYAPASGIDAEPAGTIDALFVGDSECYYSFIPLYFWQQRGYAAYVCATPNQKLYETLRWVERACRNQSPKLIVLETDSLFIRISYGERLMDPLVRAFPVLEHHDRWKQLKLSDFYAQPEYTHVVRDKGYVFDDNAAPADEDSLDYMRDTGDSQNISRLIRAYLRRIDAFCRERGIRLMLVSAPSAVTWSAARHDAVTELAARMGLEYVDLNEKIDEIGLDWSRDTFDAGYHMNYSGAVKVSDYYLKYLDGTGLLADHRGDKAYKAWKKAVKKARAKGMDLAAAGAN